MEGGEEGREGRGKGRMGEWDKRAGNREGVSPSPPPVLTPPLVSSALTHAGAPGKTMAAELNGHMPTFRNPETIFSGRIVLYQALENSDEKWHFVIIRPGLSCM